MHELGDLAARRSVAHEAESKREVDRVSVQGRLREISEARGIRRAGVKDKGFICKMLSHRFVIHDIHKD